jgi:uncharacterized membrane protein YgaE (UPF0421/DUF939 family)
MGIQLKRTVTIKVIVTEEFKKYLVSELERAIKNLDNQLGQMENQGKKLVTTLKKQGDKAKKQISAITSQINLDRQQEKLAKSDLEKKIKDAQLLPLNSEFIQGTVDGFAEVDKGDNLYKKLGALEVVIKDGIIQEIRGND